MREAPFLSSYAVTSFQKYYSIFIGLNISDGDDIELYKEGDYTEGLMPEYLGKLLQLGKLSNCELDILCNLFPASFVGPYTSLLLYNSSYLFCCDNHSVSLL